MRYALALLTAIVAFVALLVGVRNLGAPWSTVGWTAAAVSMLMLAAFFAGTEAAACAT